MAAHKHHKSSDGTYHIGNKKFSLLIGSRAQVAHGTAYKTTGGLTARDLHFNRKTGRWVSAKKSRTAKKANNLEKHGWALAKKGSFGAAKSLKKGKATKRSKSGKRTRRR